MLASVLKDIDGTYACYIKVPHHPLQSPTSPSSMYHTILFKVPHHPLQSNTPSSSKYHTTLFKVPHRPLQSTIPPSSKYHTILFKVLHTSFSGRSRLTNDRTNCWFWNHIKLWDKSATPIELDHERAIKISVTEFVSIWDRNFSIKVECR